MVQMRKLIAFWKWFCGFFFLFFPRAFLPWPTFTDYSCACRLLCCFWGKIWPWLWASLSLFFLLCILQGFSFFWSSLDLSFQDTFSLINFVSFKFIGELAGLCFVCFSFVVFSSIQTFWILLLPLFIVVFMFF